MKSAKVEVVDQWIVWEGILTGGFWAIGSGVPVFGDLPGGGPVGWTMEKTLPSGRLEEAGKQWTWTKVSLVKQLVEQMAARLGVNALYVSMTTPHELQLKAFPSVADAVPVWVAPPPRSYSPPAPPVVYAEEGVVRQWALVPLELMQQLRQLQLPADELGRVAGRLVESATDLNVAGRCPVGDPMCPEPGGHDHDGCATPAVSLTGANRELALQDIIARVGHVDELLCRSVDQLRMAKIDAANLRRYA